MRVTKVLKFVLIGVPLLLIAVIVGAVVVLKYTDFNRYKPLIAEKVRKATGRDLAIAGDLRVDISLTPGIVVDGVTLSNAEWGSRPDMVSARRLEAHVALIPLIFGVLEIERIELTGADILLETDRQGRANFDFEPPEGDREGRRQPGEGGADIGAIPLVHGAVIRDSRLTYNNGATGATYSTIVESLTLAKGGPDEPISLVYAGSYNDAPIRATAELGAIVDLLEPGKPWPVDLTLEAGGAAVTVSGMIAEPLIAAGFDLAIEVRGDQLGDVSELADTEIPPLGAYSLSTRLTGDLASVITLPDLNATLGESELAGEATATLTGEHPVIEGRFTSGKIDLAALGVGLNAPLLDAATTVSVKGGKLDIKSFRAILSGASVTANGTIDAPVKGNGLNLVVAAQGRQFGDLSQLTGAKVPALGAYSLSVRVTGDAGSKIKLARLKGQVGASDLAGEATVTRGGARTAIGAKLTSRQIDLAALGVGVNAKLQDTAAALSLKGGKLDIGSLKTTLAGAAVTVSGTIADAATLAGLDLAVAARGDRLGDLVERFGGNVPALGGYSAAGRVTGDLAATIKLSGLAAQLGGSDISGDAQVSLSGKHPAVDARFASDKIDLATLGAGHAPLRGTVAVLSLRDGKLLIKSIEANLSGAAIKVAGTISEPARAAGLDLKITAGGEQFGDLSALAGREMPALGGYAISTRVTGDATVTIRSSAFTARVGESDLTGDVTVTLTGGRPFVDAGLSSSKIDLAFLVGAAGDADGAGPHEPAKKPDRIFPDDPLPLEGLKAVDAKLRLDAATVTGRQPLLRNASVTLSLRDGLLDVQSLKAETQNGVLDGAVQIDGRTQTAGLAGRMTLRKVDLAILLAQTVRAGALEGQVNFDFDVTGQGNSVRRVMASLGGRVSLAMGKGRIRSRFLQRWVGGPTQILSNVLTLNVGGYTTINCVLGVFNIEKGVATTSGFLLDTNVAAFVGDGTIDLGTEALDLVITPGIKKMTLSVAVPVHIRGTLANPEYSSDSAAVRRRVGGLLAGLVYPPALLLGLGELGTFREGDCVVRADSTDGQATPKLPEKILKGTGETITKGIEGLLGE